MLPNCVPVVPSAVCDAQLEKGFGKFVLFQILDDPSRGDAIHKPQHFLLLMAGTRRYMSMIGHDDVGEYVYSVVLPSFFVCLAQDLFQFIGAEYRQAVMGHGCEIASGGGFADIHITS